MQEQTFPSEMTGRRPGATGTTNAMTSPTRQINNGSIQKIADATTAQEVFDDIVDTKIMRKNLINWRASNDISNALSSPMLNPGSNEGIQLPQIGGTS